MKRLLTLLITFYSVVAFGQIYDPVQWDFSQKKLSNNEIELQLKVKCRLPSVVGFVNLHSAPSKRHCTLLVT